MKRILSIQDLSCLGKCSLTVALPVLSAMGHSCTVLPTGLLSTHTAFPKPYVRSLTEDIGKIAAHWQSVGAGFDSICVGYLSDPEQAEEVLRVLNMWDTPVVLDPVMGDHGKLYSRMTGAHIDAMKSLCKRARYVLPNVTEAALLTGLTYRPKQDKSYLAELTAGLLEMGPEAAVITGICWDDVHTGFAGGTGETAFCYKTEALPRRPHGTGDLFSAVFTGALGWEKPLYDCATLAARFVEQVVAETPSESPFGVAFEGKLSWLWEQK